MMRASLLAERAMMPPLLVVLAERRQSSAAARTPSRVAPWMGQTAMPTLTGTGS